MEGGRELAVGPKRRALQRSLSLQLSGEKVSFLEHSGDYLRACLISDD